MNLPSIPTDNLYKFLAITGLILCLVSIFYPTIEGDKIDREIIQLETNTNIYLRESEHLNREQDFFEEKLDDAKLAAKSKTLSKQGRDSISRELLEIDRKVLELRIKAAEQQGYAKQILRLNSRLRLMNKCANYGFNSGVVLMFLGFILWYLQVQRYQDLIMKNEAGIASPTRSLTSEQKLRVGPAPRAELDSGEVDQSS